MKFLSVVEQHMQKLKVCEYFLQISCTVRLIQPIYITQYTNY